MKVFDEDEQDIIQKITHGHGYSRSLINILDSRNTLQGTRIKIDKVSKTANFLFQMQNNEPTDEELQWGIERQKQLIELLIKHLNLLRYLEKEELAIFFDPAKSTDQTIEFGMGAVNMPSYRMSIDDQNVIDLLIRYLHKEIMPSPSLKNLENNKFVSDDTIKFRKQYIATWVAIGASIILGLYGLYNNHSNSIAQEKQFGKHIAGNKKAVEVISEKIDQLSKSSVDYSPAIREISKEISELSEKVDLAPKHQVVEVKIKEDNQKE